MIDGFISSSGLRPRDKDSCRRMSQQKYNKIKGWKLGWQSSLQPKQDSWWLPNRLLRVCIHVLGFSQTGRNDLHLDKVLSQNHKIPNFKILINLKFNSNQTSFNYPYNFNRLLYIKIIWFLIQSIFFYFKLNLLPSTFQVLINSFSTILFLFHTDIGYVNEK